MFSAFSWGDFVQATLIILLCYYAAVGMIFYRMELKKALLSFTSPGAANKAKDVGSSRSFFQKENTFKEEAMELAQESQPPAITTKPIEDISKVFAELEEAIAAVNAENYNRRELIQTLSDIIKKYKNSIDNSAEATINAHIQSQLTICSLQPLGDEEQEWLWLN